MDNLIQYRLDNAQEKLESAEILLNAGKYKDSIGRSYYAIFSAVRAILALDRVDFSKHAGVIAYFQKEYVKTKTFDTKFSKYLQNAFQIRNVCDYDDFYIASKQDAEIQIEQAKEFLDAVKKHLSEQISLKTLEGMDKAVENFKIGLVSQEVDLLEE